MGEADDDYFSLGGVTAWGSLDDSTPSVSYGGASGQSLTVDPTMGQFQSALFGSGGVVSRLIDIELTRYAWNRMPEPARPSAQNPQADLTTRGAGALGSMRVGDLLPWLLIAGVVYAVARR